MMFIWTVKARSTPVHERELGLSSRSSCGLFWGLLVALAVSIAPTSAAEVPPTRARGLDLVVLVDMSRSMYTTREATEGESVSPPDGSDPQRIRWDAVKMVVDLLTVEDRILIGRFNSQYPTPVYAENANKPYEGRADGFPRELLQLTELKSQSPGKETQSPRERLETEIAGFNTAGIDEQTKKPDNGRNDYGGTQIVQTLNQIASQIQEPAPGRKAAVLLLTDGVDSPSADRDDWKDDDLRKALKGYTGSRDRTRVPIYCIGLGFSNLGKDEAKARSLLSRIAEFTGGEFTTARTNGDLLEIFRRRIWNLKGCFYRQYQLAPSPTSSSLEIKTAASAGILDLGLLSFETDPDEKKGPKNTSPPTHRLQITWPSNKPSEQRRTGKAGSVYDYFYFGKRSPFDERPGAQNERAVFADFTKPICLTVTLQADKLPQTLFISKRTDDDLFRMVDPAPLQAIYRYQSLPVRVAMAESRFFKPEQFEIRARIYRNGEASGQASAAPLADTGVERVPDQRLFEGRISLRNLPRGSEEVTHYTLIVTVEGNLSEDKNCSTDRFVLELPPRTIGVVNELLLQPIAPIELTRQHPAAEVQIATRYPVDEDLPVHVDVKLPERVDADKRTAVAEENFSKGCLRSCTITLKGGTAQLTIALNPAHLPEGDRIYIPGRIRVTAEGLKEQIAADLRLRIDRAQIAVEPAKLELVAQKQETATPDLQVKLSPPSQTPIGIDQLEVRLEQVEANGATASTQRFPPKEIWIQKSSETSPTRAQRMTVRLNEAFRVYAHLDHDRTDETDNPNKLYSFQLVVSGPGVDTVVCPVSLLINPPELKLRATELSLNSSPGVRQTCQFEAKLDGIEGATEHVYLVGGGKATQISLKNADSGEACTITVDSPGRDTPVKLSVAAKKSLKWNSQWTPLPLSVFIQPTMPCGRYHGEIAMRLGKRPIEHKLRFNVVVDALQVEVLKCDDGKTFRWQPADEVNLVQFFDYEMSKRIRVASQLRDVRLDPSNIQLSVGGFVDDAGDLLRAPTRIHVAPDGSTGALLVDLKFDRVSSGDPEIPYRVPIAVGYPDHSTKSVNFQVWFCRDADFLSTNRSEQTAITPSR
jgi:hypothetical protein